MVDLMKSIQECSSVPAVVVIVDASAEYTVGQILIEQIADISLKIIRIGSAPGLPHQRNIGIEFVLSRIEYQNCDIFAFLDDDVEVSSNYFEELITCFDSTKELIGVGATDISPERPRHVHLALRLALVTSRRSGKVLCSGFATLPESDTSLSETDWVPGFAVSFRRPVFESHRFSERIAFYGEDLEFQLRISHLGKLAVSNRLRVTHKQSPLSRDTIRDHWSFSDGFRWSMAEQFPNRIKKSAVIWSTLSLMFFEIVRFICSGAQSPPAELLGHCDFLRRLISQVEVEKLREMTTDKTL